MAKNRKKLGDILIEWGVIDSKQLAQAVEHSSQSRKRLGDVLIELGMVTDDQVAKAMARQFDLEYIDLTQHRIDQVLIEQIPNDLMLRHLFIPLSKEGGRLKIVIHDPLDLDMMDLLRFRLNIELDCALAPKGKIKAALDNYLNKVDSSIDHTIDEIHRSIDASIDASMDKSIDLANLDASKLDDSSAPIIKLINKIIDEACNGRASDIHIEPMADRVRVRYRVDGVCIERDNIPKQLQNVVSTRFKIMSGMDIAEKRLPLDGRIKKSVNGKDIDFRVSSLPGYHGESIVLRILRPESVLVGIQALGFGDRDYERFQKIIKRPNGIFLVTGPTGSGKTTTLYSALQVLNRPDKKIITAEDPVEFNFPGMNQCQIRHDIGLSFSKVLRSMLRQAPNIILVGEIRDQEVADIAIQAALTGHLVFSTLHTNDAPSAITRLVDMGVKPFLVASAVQAIMAQRLIRTICKECKVEDPSPELKYLKLVGFTDDEISKHTFYKGAGCKRCSGTGYKGRLGIFEMMLMTTQIRELAFNRAPSNKIRQVALASGMNALATDGKLKVINGITTVEEVARVAQVEGLV
ncbi:MAG: Flp pilus assembly complex ATPase component TadA [Phycisphaerae bacterium]|nr:Flp pilus assembly complex ATPase component TadA [Phycisphaerae bacterium]